MTELAEKNRAVVLGWNDLAIAQRQPEAAVAAFLGSGYRQHNPQAEDGPDAFVRFVHHFAAVFPDFRVDVKRVVAEGDLVMMHSHLVRESGDRALPSWTSSGWKTGRSWNIGMSCKRCPTRRRTATPCSRPSRTSPADKRRQCERSQDRRAVLEPVHGLAQPPPGGHPRGRARLSHPVDVGPPAVRGSHKCSVEPAFRSGTGWWPGCGWASSALRRSRRAAGCQGFMSSNLLARELEVATGRRVEAGTDRP
jgi:predicted SnoaL-like aldol condensation-catalyzing enzyme